MVSSYQITVLGIYIMCRYAITVYKQHYACFICRKTFKPKRATLALEHCPDCGGDLSHMGLDFKAPKRSDKIAWKAAETLILAGITYGSCGCSGPGFRPVKRKDVDSFVAEHQNRRASKGVQLLTKINARAR
jgi:hypothetical protein